MGIGGPWVLLQLLDRALYPSPRSYKCAATPWRERVEGFGARAPLEWGVSIEEEEEKRQVPARLSRSWGGVESRPGHTWIALPNILPQSELAVPARERAGSGSRNRA